MNVWVNQTANLSVMKSRSARFLLAIAVTTLVVHFSAFAQSQPGTKKGPTSKIYIVDSAGESQIEHGNKIYPTEQATAYDAPGTVIETKGKSHNSFVYSNGTGMYVDQDTRVEIESFAQEPFQADYATNLGALVEPSVSRSHVRISRGSVGLCTSKLISGSSMQYSTPFADVNVRGGRISIDANADESHIDLLEGDVTVRSGGKDIGGQILHPGERATIRPAANAGDPPTITIGPIPDDQLAAANERAAQACGARTSVTFELLAGGGAAGEATGEAAGADAEVNQQKIGAKPVLPPDPTIPVVVSPDRLPGT
jgi:hypothetical protein